MKDRFDVVVVGSGAGGGVIAGELDKRLPKASACRSTTALASSDLDEKK